MSISRRRIIRAASAPIIAIPLASLGLHRLAAASEKPRVDPEDPTAKALDYAHAAPNPSKRCANCQLYKGSRRSDWGRCIVFPGKLVNTRGWCASWSA